MAGQRTETSWVWLLDWTVAWWLVAVGIRPVEWPRKLLEEKVTGFIFGFCHRVCRGVTSPTDSSSHQTPVDDNPRRSTGSYGLARSGQTAVETSPSATIAPRTCARHVPRRSASRHHCTARIGRGQSQRESRSRRDRPRHDGVGAARGDTFRQDTQASARRRRSLSPRLIISSQWAPSVCKCARSFVPHGPIVNVS